MSDDRVECTPAVYGTFAATTSEPPRSGTDDDQLLQIDETRSETLLVRHAFPTSHRSVRRNRELRPSGRSHGEPGADPDRSTDHRRRGVTSHSADPLAHRVTLRRVEPAHDIAGLVDQ